MTLLYRSPFVMNPRKYWDSTFSTSFCAFLTRSIFSCGITTSSIETESPPFVAKVNPSVFNWSRKFAVTRLPHRRKTVEIICTRRFLFNNSFTNGISFGTIWLNIMRPVVVSIISPFIRTLIRACNPTLSWSYAMITSCGDPNRYPSPRSLDLDFVR